MPLDWDAVVAEVEAALGTEDLTPLIAGGQKRVYTGELEGLPVIVKIIQVPDTPHAAEVLERARREVELLATVDSPHVVRVLSDAVEIGDRPEAICWIEEFLDGLDLRDLTDSFPWEPEQVWTLIADVAEGLAACHEADVVHRDVSPGNVRRRADETFTLMDPGLARHLTKTAITGLYNPGTPGYLTPEHVPGGHPIPASDIFALGILAFQCLTGQLPVHYTGDDAAYYDELRSADAPSVLVLRSDLPLDLAAVVDRCLQRQPARRYIDAQELLSELPRAVRSSRS